MPTKPTLEVKSATSQRDNRWLETVYDQHKSPRFPNGRPWWGYLEHPTEKQKDPSFTCELQPGDHADPFGSSWSAPWVPTQLLEKTRTYYRLDLRARRLTWLYPAMVADDRAALQEYHQAAAKIAYEKGWAVPEYGRPVGFQIETIIGPPPLSSKIAEAALAGDPWILGNAREPNKVLEAILADHQHGFNGRYSDASAPAHGVVTPAQVLSTDPAIQAIVNAAVAAALEADRQRRVDQKLKNLQGGKKGRAARTASTAAPSGASA